MSAQPETSDPCTSVMVSTCMMSVNQEADMLTSMGEIGPLLGHIMSAL